MTDSDSQTPRHPNPEIDSLLKVEALVMSRGHEKDEAFREVLSRLDFSSRSPSPAAGSPESMPDSGSRHRDGEGEWQSYSYDRPGADQPAQTIEPIE